jgi:sigma-E factor negative regulatory protein RseA
MNTTHEKDDSLSAFLDGELSEAEARRMLRRLGDEDEARERFSEYARIGDLMRGHQHDIPDLTDRVMAALEQEPTLLAPVKKPVDRRPLLWLAAAATAAITWGLWSAAPQQETLVPLASQQRPTQPSADVMPYLAAHQDYAQAVTTPHEAGFTLVILRGDAR